MLRARKVADNYFSGRGNRTKSGINHATTRPESLRAREVDEKGARVRGEAEGPAGRRIPLARTPLPLFHSLARYSPRCLDDGCRLCPFRA